MKLRPWNLDAFRFFHGDTTKEQLIVNTPIQEFLDVEHKFFLVGAKGLGKTLFLRYKSYLYHENLGDSFKYNANHTELTENLNIFPETLSKEDLLQFRSEYLWGLIWELALWIMTFRIWKEPINSKLEKLIGNASQLSTILTRLLNNRNMVEVYQNYLMDFLENQHKIQSGVAIFIDDVDQTLYSFLRSPHRTDKQYDGRQSPSVDTWVNAQIGLIGAIYRINRQNGHIKIFATIRSEAFEAYTGELKSNYKHHASILAYEKDDIRKIFEKNIQLIENKDLLDPYHPSVIGKFLGFDEMPHRFALDQEGKKRIEDAFDFIYRHTYGRPREIIEIGWKLNALVDGAPYRTSNTLNDRIERVRNLVNKESNSLLLQYKQETIPNFDNHELELFVENVRSNIITREDRKRLDPQTLQRYFNMGLIGYTRAKNHTGILVQEFKAPATYNYLEFEPLPETDHLLIHSTMDSLLLQKHTFGHFYNRNNIIGNGYDFYPVIDNPIYPNNFYFPKDITGNRMAAASETAGHTQPLEHFYNRFFDFGAQPHRHEKFMSNWNTAQQVLFLLGRICYCNRLERQFQTGYYENKKSEFFNELGRHHYVRKYNADLPEGNQDVALDRFLDKLVGRFITTGCYLVLDMRIEWIHDLLMKGKFVYRAEVNNNSDFTYLARSFFIRDLRKEEPRDPENPAHRNQKQSIFDHLSPFEQQSLRAFITDATEEVNYLDWLEDKEHIGWVKSNVIERIWKPS